MQGKMATKSAKQKRSAKGKEIKPIKFEQSFNNPSRREVFGKFNRLMKRKIA